MVIAYFISTYILGFIFLIMLFKKDHTNVDDLLAEDYVGFFVIWLLSPVVVPIVSLCLFAFAIPFAAIKLANWRKK